MAYQPQREGQTHTITGSLPITDALISYEEEPYIAPPPSAQVVLKRGDALLLTDIVGDMPSDQKETGLFWQGTRYLHTCNLSLNGTPLVGLSHYLSESGESCQVDATNAPFALDNELTLGQGSIHVCRVLELGNNSLLQTITITNFHAPNILVTLGLVLGADFCDIFDVRGFTRIQRGILKVPTLSTQAATLGYYGADHVERETHVTFSPPANHLQLDRIFWDCMVIKGQSIAVQVRCALSTSATTYQVAPPLAPLALPTLTSDDSLFNRFLERGLNDFAMLCTPTPYGYYPYAGLPLFACPFGRDGLIASMEFLPWFPDVAKGTLTFLAAHQGTKSEPFTDEEPGKILHEYRTGELANLHEVPYLPYFGSVDATPLFLMVLEKYVRWTNDIYLLRQLWPNAMMAARWLTTFGDKDGDGFVEYHKASSKGLVNQGWKDAQDSISHADGRLASGSVAPCEVQGYSFAAYRAMSYLADRLGKRQDSQNWELRAQVLQQRFLKQFWWEEEQTFYLALDGTKEPCKVVSSNVGHCLSTGIIPDTYAQKTIERLLREDMRSGWGIRTLSTQAARYNPMSYHNGSVWPHDTALAGAGFAHYLRKTEAGQLLHDLYTASHYQKGMHLPELYCGFARRTGFGPTRYPGACSPQAWAAGAPFLLLSGLLGLQPHAERQSLTLVKPTLPPWLHSLEMKGMKVRGEMVHVHLERSGETTNVSIGKDNQVDIEIL